MIFDYNYDPADDPKLSSHTADLMRATRNYWRDLGLSVQYFSNATGELTEWSFSSVTQRDAFIKKHLKDKLYAISDVKNKISN